MNWRYRAALCVSLALAAGVCVGAVAETWRQDRLTEVSAQAAYVLREQDGRVCIFAQGSDEPLQVTDIETALLPTADRESLARGIGAGEWSTVLMLMEDLGS